MSVREPKMFIQEPQMTLPDILGSYKGAYDVWKGA